MKSLAHDVMLESVSVLHYEAHLFLRAFLTNNNRRMMVGLSEHCADDGAHAER